MKLEEPLSRDYHPVTLPILRRLASTFHGQETPLAECAKDVLEEVHKFSSPQLVLLRSWSDPPHAERESTHPFLVSHAMRSFDLRPTNFARSMTTQMCNCVPRPIVRPLHHAEVLGYPKR